ncbi:MAG: holin family protein [Prolixibacteraceae bacterium]|nr:holin family protein [Prolixibacteraceae bacterium]
MANILSTIFSKSAGDIIDSTGKVIDNLTTSDQEKLTAKNELTKTVLQSLNTLQNAQRDVLLNETRGNWLQRSWRPILMLTFGFILVYAYFIEPAFVQPEAEKAVANIIDPKFWALLEIGVGGYIIGRSAEKITGTVTRNTDITLLKKKDRKDIYG